jgi:hypothetical protein
VKGCKGVTAAEIIQKDSQRVDRGRREVGYDDKVTLEETVGFVSGGGNKGRQQQISRLSNAKYASGQSDGGVRQHPPAPQAGGEQRSRRRPVGERGDHHVRGKGRPRQN